VLCKKLVSTIFFLILDLDLDLQQFGIP
jgi:hypothetical protein